jgi:ATP-dependent helicase/nuclease subunit B
MLQLILGRSGSGKTYTMRSALKALAESGAERLMLIVPEQASFENERAMLRLLGEKNARRVEVTSFSRLTDAVQRRYGGFAGRRLDDGGRSIFMSLALGQVRDQLEVFRRNAESTELVNLLLQISAELKMCEITPEKLGQAASAAPSSTLKRKAEEISLILSAYDALVARSYVDPLDDLTRMKEILKRHDFFSGYTVMVDSFQSFTVQEYGILEIILRQADDVRIALCADNLSGPDAGLFTIARRTAGKLLRLAAENGVRAASPILLPGGARFRSPELAVLEERLYRPGCGSWDHPCPNVTVYTAKDRYDEAAFVCASIRHLVKDEGMRYRDFAVITRSVESYFGILDAAFERWEIPYFMDRPEAVDAEPLMRLVLTAFRIVTYGFRSDDVFLYLKTGLAGLTPQQIPELENYTFVWNLSGGKWKEEWTDNPEGFAGPMDKNGEELLAQINESRKIVVGPLERFAKDTAETEGIGMASAVYRLLCDVGAAEHLREYAGRLAQEGNPALAERELRTWDLLMQILDQTALVIGEDRLSRERYAELLQLVIRSSRMASIPQGLDEVTVGDANRIRTEGPRVVFVVGTVQGEFPMTPGGDCVFSDSERRELIRLGLPLNDTAEGVALQERFLAYSAVTAPSQKLFVTYPVADGAGRALTPSSIPDGVQSALPQVRRLDAQELPPLWFANAEGPALELAAQKWNANDTLSASLRDLFTRRKSGVRLGAVGRAAQKEPFRFRDPSLSRTLFGGEMKLSATQIEKFELCRFQYFCCYGLNVRERRTAELNALEYGSLMHFLLQRLFQGIGAEKILAMKPDELHEAIVGFLDEYVRETFGGMETKTPRFAYLVSRIADSAQTVALHVARELSQSEFSPADFELEIGGSVGALSIPLPEGGTVRVDGKIDRVDLMDRDGERYLRIIDYKTGKKEFRLSDLVYGLNMQMLIYLAALCENGRKRYGEFLPAGILYMPAYRPSVPAERGTDKKLLAGKTERQLRMDGLIIDDPGVIEAMDRGGNGDYIPVALKDGVPDKKDHVVSPKELEAVMAYLKRCIAEMASELQKGNVPALPLNGTRTDACSWCPYRSVCGRETDDPVREMQDWDRDAAMQELERDGKEGEKV